MSEANPLNAAILLLALGEDGAAEVMKHLGPTEVEKITMAMKTLTAGVEQKQIDSFLTEFCREASSVSPLRIGPDQYIRTVLTKAHGEDKASALLNRILGAQDESGIEALKWLDAKAVAELIGNELPQVIATILAHLDGGKAAQVLTYFPQAQRNDVTLRIATLDSVQPAAMRELNEMLTRLVSGNENLKKRPIGGVKATAGILNFLGRDLETSVIESIMQHDPGMAQAIVDEMLVFENLLDIDDKGMKVLLREVDQEALIVALKGASVEMREKVFGNLAQRTAEMLREDLEAKGPVKLADVEIKQKEIVQTARRLADENQIILGGKGGGGGYV